MNPRTVWVAANVSDGMFPSEKVVKLDTTTGERSFFVATSAVKDAESGRAQVRGALLGEDQRHALVEIPTQDGGSVVKVEKSNLSEKT